MRCLHRTLAVFLTVFILIGFTACQKQTTPSSSQSTEPEQTASSESSGSPAATKSPESQNSADPSEPLFTTPEPKLIPVKRIIVEIGSEEAVRGAIIEPKVTIRPSDATDKSYTLKSEDENVLRLVDGRWTAVGAGTTGIIATAANGVIGYAAVTVIVPVEVFSLGVQEITINRGDSITLTPVITPADATDQNIKYISGDESISSISWDGTITGVSAGTTVIEGIVDNVRDTCTVTVVVPVTGIKISTDKRAYKVGDQGEFVIEIEPKDATDKTYAVNISGTVSDLPEENTFFCAVGGEITITATAANGVSDKQTVIVIDLVAYADEMFRLTNTEREKEGLSPLSGMASLTQVAVIRASEIIRSFSHDRPDGRSCFSAYNENDISYFWAGENIAMGQRTPADAVQAWMDSPGHKENILKSEFKHLGAGVAMDNNGRLYWVQNFTD